MSLSLLFDESLPHPIRDSFEEQFSDDHKVVFVQDMEWDSFDNGELLKVAQEEFDVLVTADTSIQNHTELENYEIAVLILHGPSNRLEDLQPLVPEAVDSFEAVMKQGCMIVSYE